MINTICGHDDDDAIEVSVCNHTAKNEKCIDFVCICRDCYTNYKSEDRVLYNKEQEDAWLRSIN